MRNCLLLLLLGLPATLLGQPPRFSDSARIYVLTEAPGAEVYSQWGHSAFRLHDPARGLDVVFNYGTFSFSTDYFVLKFARGQLDYLLSVEPYARWLAGARQQNRTVTAQALNVSPTQLNALAEALVTNAQPENRAYRYDFFYDNCATRIKTIVEQALGDSVRFDDRWAAPVTFRHTLGPYLADNPWLRLGIHLGLGAGADRTATAHEQTYLPDSLAKAYATAEVCRGGTWVPLAGPATTVAPGQPMPPALPDYPLMVALGVLALALGASYRQLRGRSQSRPTVFDRVLFTLVGFAGVFLLLLWLATEHRVTPNNWNILWAFAPHGCWVWLPARIRRRRAWASYGYLAAGLALCVGVLGLLGVQYFPPTAYVLALVVGVRALALARYLHPVHA